MKKIYEMPEIEAIAEEAEDIITLSYMLPEMPAEENVDVNSDSSDRMR